MRSMKVSLRNPGSSGPGGCQSKLKQMDGIAREHHNRQGATGTLPPVEIAEAIRNFLGVLGSDGLLEVDLSRHIRTVGQSLKRLARYASWLASHPTENGWEVEVGPDVPIALARPATLKVRPQPDFSDPIEANQKLLAHMGNILKPKADLAPSDDTPEPDHHVVADEVSKIAPPMSTHDAAMARLLSDLAHRAQHEPETPLSLVQWKAGVASSIDGFDGMPVDLWLLYAVRKLVTTSWRLELVRPAHADLFPVNTRFHDVNVWSAVATDPHSEVALP